MLSCQDRSQPTHLLLQRHTGWLEATGRSSSVDAEIFDRVTRSLSAFPSRRRVVSVVAGLAAVGPIAATGCLPPRPNARRKGRRPIAAGRTAVTAPVATMAVAVCAASVTGVRSAREVAVARPKRWLRRAFSVAGRWPITADRPYRARRAPAAGSVSATAPVPLPVTLRLSVRRPAAAPPQWTGRRSASCPVGIARIRLRRAPRRQIARPANTANRQAVVLAPQ
jgi:hypothetical protein